MDFFLISTHGSAEPHLKVVDIGCCGTHSDQGIPFADLVPVPDDRFVAAMQAMQMTFLEFTAICAGSSYVLLEQLVPQNTRWSGDG